MIKGFVFSKPFLDSRCSWPNFSFIGVSLGSVCAHVTSGFFERAVESVTLVDFNYPVVPF